MTPAHAALRNVGAKSRPSGITIARQFPGRSPGARRCAASFITSERRPSQLRNSSWPPAVRKVYPSLVKPRPPSIAAIRWGWSKDAASRPTEPRAAGPLPQLPLPGRLLGPTVACDRQSRTSSRGTVPPSGLHRDHLDRDEPSRCPFLQPAGHRRAMDQGRQDGHPLDPTLLPSVPGQRGAVAARRHRLQPRQFAAPTRSPRRHPKLVPDEPPAALVQDRWAAHSPRPVLHLTARRKLLDRVSLSPDPCAHRGADMASDVIDRAASVLSRG